MQATECKALRENTNSKVRENDAGRPFPKGSGLDWQRIEDQVLQVQDLTWSAWSTALEEPAFQRWFAGWLLAIQETGLQWRKKGEATFTALIDLLNAHEEREIDSNEMEKMLKVLPLRWHEHVELMQKIDQFGRERAPRVRELISQIDALSSDVILAVYPYVTRISQRYSTRVRSASLSREDLASRAYFAIPMAFRSWDKNRGPFRKALSLWITQEMMDELLVQSTVHEPEHLNFLRSRLRESEFFLRQSLQRQPSPEELAEHSGQPLDVVRGLRGRPLEMVSMDAGMESDSDVPGRSHSLHDILPANASDPSAAALGLVDRKMALAEIKRLLEPRLKDTRGALGFQLPLHLIKEAEGKVVALPEALDVLREIGYENLRGKLTGKKSR